MPTARPQNRRPDTTLHSVASPAKKKKTTDSVIARLRWRFHVSRDESVTNTHTHTKKQNRAVSSPPQDRRDGGQLVQPEAAGAGATIDLVLPVLLRPLVVAQSEKEPQKFRAVDAPTTQNKKREKRKEKKGC